MRPIIRTGSMPEDCEICGAKLSKLNTSNKCYQCLKKESLNKRAQKAHPRLCSGCGAQIDRAEKHWTDTSGRFVCNACYEDPKRLKEPRFCSDCGGQIDRAESWILEDGSGFLCNACNEERKKAALAQQQPKKQVEEQVKYLGYLGGFAGVTRKHTVDMRFEATQLTIVASFLGKAVLWAMPYDKIKGIRIDTSENLTAARLLLVGILAFGLKKKHRYLVVSFEDAQGLMQNPVFEGGQINDAQKEIYKRIEQARSQLSTIDQQPQKPQAATIDVAEQIKKLGELRDQGLLTEQEFDSKKQELLARM